MTDRRRAAAGVRPVVVVLEHVVLKSNPVFDVNQVEVLRGPQGSLFGRNTTAGIIKFDTIRPDQQFEGRARASVGSYGTTTFDMGVGGPIIRDLLAFRVSALLQHRSNWVDNRFAGVSVDRTATPRKDAMGGFDERDVRLQLLLTPDENASVLLSGHARWYDFVLYRTREFYAKGNFEGGVKVGYKIPGDDYEVAVFARNVTNEKNLKGVIENYNAAVFNEPRVIGVSLSGRFR